MDAQLTAHNAQQNCFLSMLAVCNRIAPLYKIRNIPLSKDFTSFFSMLLFYSFSPPLLKNSPQGSLSYLPGGALLQQIVLSSHSGHTDTRQVSGKKCQKQKHIEKMYRNRLALALSQGDVLQCGCLLLIVRQRMEITLVKQINLYFKH